MKTVSIRAAALAAAALVLCLSFSSCDLLGLIGVDPTDDALYAANVDAYSGTLAGNATFAAGRVSYVSSTLYVPSGATLTIQPGAIVKFAIGAGIDVQDGGRIVADGTVEAPILFTAIADDAAGGDSQLNGSLIAPVAGSYSYIWIHLNSSANVFDHCEFRYGGANDQSVLYLDGAASVTNCDFHDNSGGVPGGTANEAVLHVQVYNAATVLTGNRFWNNRWPLAIPVNMDLDDSNEFSYDHDGDAGTADLVNVYKQIFVSTYDRGATIERPVSWSETELPFCVHDDVILIGTETVSGSLTLANGVVLKFAAAAGLSIEASGVLTGALAEFTSIDDDSLLGDARNDGTAGGIAVWDGIWDVDSDAYLAWANIHYSAN
ncbi:MAG: hypothetical protein KBC36_01575 [Spirochaetia bacterium]|nr:hypothetical protein [Spirochaetia bacterium]